jgi:NADPH:quinone reductase-like Zn-dependent oxidoreductase
VKAILYRSFGGPEVLRLEEVPDPKPGPGEVLVRVRAAGVNFFDTEIRGGLIPQLPLPHLPGLDGSGIIEATGPGVDASRKGQQVIIWPFVVCGECPQCVAGREQMCERMVHIGVFRPGAYAELIAIPSANAIEFNGMSFEEAACVPVGFSTAWNILINRGGIKPGSTLLVVGASGTVGTAAVQIAKLAGARVFAATSRTKFAKQIMNFGAEAVFDYRTQDAWQLAKDANGGRGLDFILDNGGAATVNRSLDALGHGGVLLIVGGAAGEVLPALNLRSMWFGHRSLVASGNGTRLDLHTILGEIGRGRLKPVLAGTHLLSQAAEAHRALVAGERLGHLVLVP